MVRIDWDRSYCYFPPRDIQEFREAVERWCPGVLVGQLGDSSANVDARETGNPYQSPLSDLTPPPRGEDDDELLR